MGETGITWGEVTGIILPVVTLAVGSVIWIQKQINDVRKDLADYKETVAKEYVTQATMEKVEERILQAINRLGDRFDSLILNRKPD